MNPTASTDAMNNSVKPVETSSSNKRYERPMVETVRAEWKKRLPDWMQPFLTWLIACPYAGEEPLMREKPWWTCVVVSLVVLTSGVAASAYIVNHGGYAWIAIPIAWLLTVQGARTLQVQICHQGIHSNLSGNSAIDRVVVEVASTVAGVQDYTGYKADHDGIHHPKLASNEDPDRIFILQVMKIKPGSDVRANKICLLMALISPRIHVMFLLSRINSNFVKCPPYRRILSLTWLVLELSIIVATEQWPMYLFGLVIPMTVLFHASAMLQFLTEHLWVKQRQPGQLSKDHYLALLLNRHLGDPLPNPELRGQAWWQSWTIWWTRLVFYHLPFRAGVLPADLPVHGSHHLWPKTKGWTNAAFTYRSLAQKHAKCPVEIVGGYVAMLDYVLCSFAEASADVGSDFKKPLSFGQAMAVTNGM